MNIVYIIAVIVFTYFFSSLFNINVTEGFGGREYRGSFMYGLFPNQLGHWYPTYSHNFYTAHALDNYNAATYSGVNNFANLSPYASQNTHYVASAAAAQGSAHGYHTGLAQGAAYASHGANCRCHSCVRPTHVRGCRCKQCLSKTATGIATKKKSGSCMQCLKGFFGRK